ncbi:MULTISPECIES: hypothetical protein [Ensifer]|jgi:hypothetical protein|uniref:hypothetical protein n=1 Tax=Ensifer TaxID=106591 RepID=UPI000D8CE69C|nr:MULTISPECIES: hypothetical protein [Ensifer]MBD9560125.1 hypothetical protein [Ensifer sp. ENS03]MCY1745353.1 hypothetical protein [Ensifer sp. SL37]RAR99701.1 hypothetical protein DEU52_14629 [Ensifer adhaerens]UTV41007.1 hypothetical protein MYG64_35340 [Ensifer adhaerens]
MSLTNARVQILLGWLLMIVGGIVGWTANSSVGTGIWGVGAALLIVVSVLYIISKFGGRLGGA